MTHFTTTRSQYASDDIIQSIQAIQKAQPCFFDMSHVGNIYVSGKDAQNFLQGQVTCDMNLLTADIAQPAVCCNLQGRVVALFFIMRYQDGYLLMLPKDIVKSTLNHFKRYATFSKVTFEDDKNCVFIGFFKKLEANFLDSLNLRESEPESQPIFFSCLDNLFIGVFSREYAGQYFSQYKKISTLLGSTAWHYQQMIRGIPEIYPHTQNVFLPHRMGLQNIDNIISFNKGCYLGQEIIARTHFKAVLKHSVYLCEISSSSDNELLAHTALNINPGDSLLNKTQEENIGEIFDVATISDYQKHFLAAIKKDAISELAENIKILKEFTSSR